MIENHPYTAMLVTGIMHWVLGLSASICGIVGLFIVNFSGNIFRIYCSVALFTATMVSLVGSLGTSAGRRKFSDSKIRKLKLGYMVTSILSACIFSLVGLAMFCFIFTIAEDLNEHWARFIAIGYVGTVIMVLEFVLAIVSASICCCCSK